MESLTGPEALSRALDKTFNSGSGSTERKRGSFEGITAWDHTDRQQAQVPTFSRSSTRWITLVFISFSSSCKFSCSQQTWLLQFTSLWHFRSSYASKTHWYLYKHYKVSTLWHQCTTKLAYNLTINWLQTQSSHIQHSSKSTMYISLQKSFPFDRILCLQVHLIQSFHSICPNISLPKSGLLSLSIPGKVIEADPQSGVTSRKIGMTTG